MDILLKYASDLAAGAAYTMGAAAVGVLISLTMGTVFGIVAAARVPVARALLAVYSEIIRNTPELVQLFWIYLILPSLGLSLTISGAVLVYLSVNGTAYTQEVVRGGVLSVPRGQWEASQVLGLSRWRTYGRIVIPQALRAIVPSLLNEIIRVLKNTTLVSLIAAPDLIYVANHLTTLTFRPIAFQLFAGAFYFVVITLISVMARRVSPVEGRRV